MKFVPAVPFDLPFLPPSLNFRHEQFFDVLLRARTELGELNGYSSSVPNPMLFLSPAIIRESVASSSIENINTTVEQVLQMQLFPEAEQRPLDKEVLRYREAISWGAEQIKKIPISTRLVQGLHSRLLPDAKKGYRTIPNAISNSTTGEILYTPPPAQNIQGLIGNWENFLHAEDGIDPLIKCAIAHYQFEAIHPFADGNGRTGRMLMVLSLMEQGLLSLPILYISGYINKNRGEYYTLLQGVNSHQRWHEFILYMLKGFHSQAKQTKDTLLRVMKLLEKIREHVRTKHKKIYTAELVEALFSHPVMTPVNLGKRLDVHYRTASRYLNELVQAKILRESFVGKYHLYVNTSLLDLLKS
ncbi:MAG: Fic family protein [Ignavibacteriae bacterium]|nr:Fic family protein [Ignavibacteriota bacterium]